MTTAGNVNAATTAFLCPVTDDDPRAREKLGVILQIVRGQHMTVSDEDMVEALQLVESTADDLPTPQSTHLYYIRSWTLSTAELRHIIQVWEDEDIRPPDAWAWLGRVICRDDSDLCYMRYVGTTKGTTPFLRFMDDQSERTGGMLSDFQAALMEASPEAYAAGKTYTMSSATLSIIAPAPAPAPAPASAPAVPLLVCCHPGDRERFLIAFFGLDYLLNVQTGGFYPSYLPSPTDRDLFAALNTAFFPTMEAQAQPIDADTAGRLATWANSVQQDSEDHPVETGCGMYPMTDEKISVMLDQATPHQLNGHTVVALIGKDITREDYFQPKTFLSGSSRAGFLTRDLLARYQATETNTALMPSLLPAIFLPFCDLFPWLSHKELLLAIAQLHRYLILVKPLVTVTFSRLVTSVLRANCKHAYGCSTRRFLLREVGIPVIQEYSPRDWLANNQLSAPPAGYATIVIPHIHPGRDKYGFQPAELRRVLDLTWMITMHTMSEATRLVSTNVTATHDALVTGVFDALAPGVSAPFDAVVAELDKAKKALHQLWEKERANRRRTMTPLGDLGLRRLRAEERMERGEVAVGIRGSSERETQLWTLWKLDLPDLKIHMDPPVQRRAWMMWAREVKEGKHYFAVALHDSANRGDLDPLRHILAAFAPEGTVPGDNTWMEDPALRKAALKAKSRDMMNKSPADHLKWAKQRARCLKGLQDSPEYEFRSVMEGRQVKITSSGKLRLYWKEDNKDVSILLSTRVPTVSLYDIDIVLHQRLI
ncbi:hypothetical protein HKX48_007038 [Thoreauomyces humboldtii]|nr:hypothetical protein HKX48_007038 [Thoreauomyces humboldtii]